MPAKTDNLGPAAKEQYDAGIKFLNAKKLDEALACFDRARCMQRHSFLIEDARVKALSELRTEGWFPRAFEAARALVTRFGTGSPRALYRFSEVLAAARLFSLASVYLKHAMQHPAYAQQTEAVRKVLTDKLAKLEAQVISYNADPEQLPEDVELVRLRLEKDLVQRPEKQFIDRLPDDVLLEIARHGQAMDEDLPAKMGRVCRRWRSLVLGTPSMWSSLSLRRNKAVKKAKVYLERSRGNITALVVAQDMVDDFAMVMDVLESTMSRLRSCRIDAFCDSNRMRRLIHASQALRHLSLSGSEISMHELADLPQLQTVKLTRHRGPLWEHDQNPKSRLPPWTKLQIEWSGASNEDALASSLPALMWTISRVRDVELKVISGTVFWAFWNDESFTDIITMQTVRLSCPSIRRRLREYGDGLNIRLPKVEHLDLRGNASWFCRTMLSESVPGSALSNLTYLDISEVGSCQPGQVCFSLSMIDTLRKMVSLRFLNVSSNDLTDSFFEALMPTTEKDDFGLPSLVALSAAGNPELTAAPIRDLVMSRVTPAAWPPKSRTGLEKKVAAPVAAGAFRPHMTGEPVRRGHVAPAMSRQKRKADSLDDLIGLGSSRIRNRAMPQTFTPGTSSRDAPDPPSDEIAKAKVSPKSCTDNQATGLEEPPQDAVAPSRRAPQRIQWLCLDHCEKIEPTLASIIGPHMRFISLQTHGRPVEDRIRGLGRYRWDAE